jgi:hypothetical protein
MSEERWDDDRANRLLDAALVVLDAVGGWEAPEEGDQDDPASLHLGSPNFTSARTCAREFGPTSI